MCSVLAGLTALSGLVQYEGNRQAANAQAKMYEYQAKVADINAKQEGRKQEQIADKYAREGEALRQRQRLIAGQQRAQAGAAGLGLAGSPMDILAAGIDAYNQDKEVMLSNQRNDNYNSRVAQSNYLNQASSYRAAAANTRSVARMQGIATILGTAASIYGMDLGGGSRPINVASSNTSSVGTNTTANWAYGKGYNFATTKKPGQWGRGLSLGNFGSNNYFTY